MRKSISFSLGQQLFCIKKKREMFVTEKIMYVCRTGYVTTSEKRSETRFPCRNAVCLHDLRVNEVNSPGQSVAMWPRPTLLPSGTLQTTTHSPLSLPLLSNPIAAICPPRAWSSAGLTENWLKLKNNLCLKLASWRQGIAVSAQHDCMYFYALWFICKTFKHKSVWKVQ